VRGLLLLSILVTSTLFLTGCGVAGQADTTIIDTETQPIQTIAVPTTTTTQTTKTQTATNTEPAVFSVSGLTIEPREVATGEYFTISVTVTNTGNSQGIYDAILYIKEINAEDPENVIIISINTITKSVIIAAGESKKVIFDSLTLQDGIYTATIDELIDYFEVGC